jgi:cell wall-associated NlpC family hydrolase
MSRYAGRHRKDRAWLRNIIVLATFMSVAAVIAIGGASLHAPPAAPAAPAEHAVLASSTETLGARMLDQAETRTGDWYFFGGAGPWVFDCSGLVYWAAGRIGLGSFPRSTYSMLASPRLVRTYSPRRGDLAFYGSGHVEFVTIWYHTTFGAQTWGTRVGWHRWSSWWHPTMFYRIVW